MSPRGLPAVGKDLLLRCNGATEGGGGGGVESLDWVIPGVAPDWLSVMPARVRELEGYLPVPRSSRFQCISSKR